MGLLRGLRAWGAVEEHARWLHRIKNLIWFGQLVGFGLSDLTLVHLQHVDPERLQGAACSVRWINSLTMPLLPGHISRYVQDHCASPDISGHVVAYIYAITKTTATAPLSIILLSIILILISSRDKKQLSYLNLDMSATFVLIYSQSDTKMLLKSIIIILLSILWIAAGFWYFFESDHLLILDMKECFLITGYYWFLMAYPVLLFITIYRICRFVPTARNNTEESSS